MAWQRTLSLPTGCLVKVDEHRAVVELPRTGVARRSSSSSSSGDSIGGEPTEGWNAISSAIWNGGSRSFRCRSSTSNSNSNSNSRSTSNYSNSYENKVCVFNYKVPCTYDGLSPEPRALLRTAIGKERYSSNSYCDEKKGNSDNNSNNDNDNGNGNNNNNNNSLDDKSTVGIMTAASMKSLRTASRSAGGIFVDVVVTAGISNSRTAGADADVFSMLPQQQDERNTGNDSKSSNNKTTATAPQEHQPRAPPPGTINTVVVINGAPLSEGAVVEAYAIAIEAKCAACADFRLPCAKSLYGNDLAQGTGTDCAVLLTPLASPHSTSASTNSTNVPLLEYAGKHCLLAELIGQAVREATREAILSNLIHLHGSLWRYHGHRWKTYFIGLLLRGARPCVPPKPMDSIPPAPLAVLLLGWGMVLVAYGIHVLSPFLLPRSATVLIAATFWDRCLPEPPLSVHPVVLAGTVISIATKQWIPERIFRSPFLGFCGGVLFLLGTLSLFASGAHLFLVAVRWAAVEAATATIGSDDNNIYIFQQHLMKFVSWLLEVMLFKTTFSLQLLCTIALQMARFLERSQLQDARNQLVWLCSRDPTHLGSEDLAGGTLESLSVSRVEYR
uniref:Uncharacterized protein n=1 Tax=Pseudo-nitzschia australis TaxID=44445 RepID=A0A7S4EIN2_9STRA